MGTQNVANCPGLKLFTRTGYCVTSPMDFRIWTDGDGISYRYEQVTTFARHSNFIGDHPPEQVVPLTKSKFDESLIPILDEDSDIVRNIAVDVLKDFPRIFCKVRLNGLRTSYGRTMKINFCSVNTRQHFNLKKVILRIC